MSIEVMNKARVLGVTKILSGISETEVQGSEGGQVDNEMRIKVNIRTH